MDQVRLPSVVNQEYNFTMDGDKSIHISVPSKTLKKYHYMLHVVVNTGEGEKLYG